MAKPHRFPVSQNYYDNLRKRVDNALFRVYGHRSKTMTIYAMTDLEGYMAHGTIPDHGSNDTSRLIFFLFRSEIDKAMARSRAARERARLRREQKQLQKQQQQNLQQSQQQQSPASATTPSPASTATPSPVATPSHDSTVIPNPPTVRLQNRPISLNHFPTS